jgi:hypothetical protein
MYLKPEILQLRFGRCECCGRDIWYFADKWRIVVISPSFVRAVVHDIKNGGE